MSHLPPHHPLDDTHCKEHFVYDLNPLGRVARALTATLVLCCGLLSVSYADIPPNRPKASGELPIIGPDPIAETTPSSAEPVTDPTTGSADAMKAREPSASELAKEQRLEDLRYKHLWIAYSIVWLVIFMFIRSTWKRSEAVAARLDELKGRVKRLEAQRSSEEG